MRKQLLFLALGLFLIVPTVGAQEVRHDLHLRWVNFTEDGLAFAVENTGNTTIPKDETVVLYEWLECTSISRCSRKGTSFDIPLAAKLEPGEEVILESKDVPALGDWIEDRPFGVDLVQISLDASKKLVEVSESNNSWKERPISPGTTARELVQKDSLFPSAKTEIRILPGNVLYLFKDLWRFIQGTFAFSREKIVEKRLLFAQERLEEIIVLLEKNTPSAISRSVRKIGGDLEKARHSAKKLRATNENLARKLEEQTIQETLRIQIILDEVELLAPIQETRKIRREREGVFIDLGRHIFDRGVGEGVQRIAEDLLYRRDKSPFDPIRSFKIYHLVTKYLPGEEKEFETIGKELARTIEERLTFLPQETKNQTEDYISGITIQEEDALELINRIQQTTSNPLNILKQAKAGITKKRNIRLQVEKEEKKKMETPRLPRPKDPEILPEFRESTTTLETPEEPLCTAEYDPVCGVDDVTYSSTCAAQEIEGVEIAHEGECELPDPDLYITGVTILPEGARGGDYIELQAQVANNGGTAQKLSRTRLRLDIDLNGTHDIIPPERTHKLIRTSSSVPVAWKELWKAREGIHRVEICADWTRRVRESNEQNNCTVLGFEVGPASSSTNGVATSTEE